MSRAQITHEKLSNCGSQKFIKLIFQIYKKKSISGGFLPSLAQLCAGLGKRYLQLRTTLTFRETGNVRLVLEAWQTKTLKRSSRVRDLYTIRLTITPPRLLVTSSVESKITPLCHHVTLGSGIPRE